MASLQLVTVPVFVRCLIKLNAEGNPESSKRRALVNSAPLSIFVPKVAVVSQPFFFCTHFSFPSLPFLPYLLKCFLINTLILFLLGYVPFFFSSSQDLTNRHFFSFLLNYLMRHSQIQADTLDIIYPRPTDDIAWNILMCESIIPLYISFYWYIICK